MRDFAENSTLLKLAQLNLRVVRNLWAGFSAAEWWKMPVIFPIAALYTVLLLPVAGILAVTSVVDLPRHLIVRITATAYDKADDLCENVGSECGIVASVFYPLLVVALSSIVVALSLVPVGGLGPLLHSNK